jgi:hypothetical protein
MAQLPADRTKLNAAVQNQQPSFVADAIANREALVEAYDTIDLLNQKVDTAISNGKMGNDIASNVDMKGYKLINLGAPSASNDAARKAEVDGKVSKSGDTMTGDLSMGYVDNGMRRLIWETPGSLMWIYYYHSISEGRNEFGIWDDGNIVTPFTYLRAEGKVKFFENFFIDVWGNVINRLYVGEGSPEGNITAPPGAIYQDKGSPGGLYIKDTGTGNMGWKKVQTA